MHDVEQRAMGGDTYNFRNTVAVGQEIGCQTFYDRLFHHWGNRLRGKNAEVVIVEDSDDEDEKAEVESLRLSLEAALGAFPPKVDVKAEPLEYGDGVKLDGYEAWTPVKPAQDEPAALQDKCPVKQEPEPNAKMQKKDTFMELSVEDINLKIQELQLLGLYSTGDLVFFMEGVV